MTPPVRPAVSVVIPAYNAAGDLARQLAALRPQLRADDEVLVADNRSTDGTAEQVGRLAQDWPGLRSLPALERQDVNHARNTGLQAAGRELVLICDADDVVHPGWVDALVAGLEQHDIVGGSSHPVDAQGRALGPAQGLLSVLGGPRYALGANVGMCRAVPEAIGGFDEAFAEGHDEADFCWRAQAAGFSLGSAPEARIDYRQRSDPRSRTRQTRGSGRTSILLWARHPDVAAPHSVNLRSALRHAARGLPLAVRLVAGRGDLEEAGRWGWVIGVLEGHLRYRILRRVPPPIIPAIAALPTGDQSESAARG